MRFTRTSLLVCVLGLPSLAACESSGGRTSGEPSEPDPGGGRVSIRVEGGQTGAEGGCIAAPERPLDFSVEDVQALVLGRHETTLAHRPSWHSVDEAREHGKRMIIEVSARGEPEPFETCSQWLMRLPVEVKLSLDEPALDLIIEHTIIAYRADVAVLDIELPAEVAEQLGLEEARSIAPWSGTEESAYFSLWFGPDGLRGDVQSGAGCGSLVFPAGRTCVHAGGLEVQADDSLRAALEKLATLSALPVTLPDGTSTSLSIELQGEPTHLCAQPFPLTGNVRAGLSARVRSADAQIDAIVEGELLLYGAAPDHVPNSFFNVNGFLPADAAHSVPYFSAMSDAQLAQLSVAVLNLGSSPRVVVELDTLTANATGQKVVEPLWVREGGGQYPGCFGGGTAPRVGVDRDE